MLSGTVYRSPVQTIERSLSKQADRKAESSAVPCFIVCERTRESSKGLLCAAMPRKITLSRAERDWKTEKNVMEGNSKLFDPRK